MTTPKEILKEAIGLHGSLGNVSRATKLKKSTLKRINNGQTKKCHAKTLALLVEATQEHPKGFERRGK